MHSKTKKIIEKEVGEDFDEVKADKSISVLEVKDGAEKLLTIM